MKIFLSPTVNTRNHVIYRCYVDTHSLMIGSGLHYAVLVIVLALSLLSIFPGKNAKSYNALLSRTDWST